MSENHLKTVCIEEHLNKDEVLVKRTYHSYVTNASSCLGISNLEKVINKCIDNANLKSLCKKSLEESVNAISNITLDTNIKGLRTFLEGYFVKYFGDNLSYLDLFLNEYINSNIKNYFKVKYLTTKGYNGFQDKIKSRKNIIFDFNNENFRKVTGIVDDWDKYEITYRHCFIITLFYQIFIENGLKEFDIKAFYYHINNALKLTLLTGIDVITKFELDTSYSALYEEFSQLIPLASDEMNFKFAPEKQTIDITIKDSAFLSEAYSAFSGKLTNNDIGKPYKHWDMLKGKVTNRRVRISDLPKYSYDSYLDTKDISIIRLLPLENPKRFCIKVYLSGRSIISRVIKPSANAKDKVYMDTLYENMYIPDDLSACLLWRVIYRTKQYREKVFYNRSYMDAYLKLIENTPNKRNIALKTATVIQLVFKDKVEQEQLINKYFKKSDTKQKAEIRETVRFLEGYILEINEENSALVKFFKGLSNYAW